MKNKILNFIAISLCLLSFQAFAIDLQTAKNHQLVGETPSGYLAAVKSPTAAVKALIKDVNAKRQMHYNKIAQKNGASLRAVEQLAGQKVIKKTKPGHYIQIGGEWRVK